MKGKARKRKVSVPRMVRLEYLSEGATLSGDTFDDLGFYLYPAYTVFTREIIDGLRARNISRIFYTPDIDDEPLHPFHDRSKTLMNMLEESVKTTTRPDLYSIRRLANDLYEFLSSTRWEIIDLLISNDGDEYAHTHAYNVGALTMAMAYRHGMDSQSVIEAGMGGFLHDIGKLAVPRHLLTKDDLSNEEFSRIQAHTRKGTEFLARFGDIPGGVLRIVHQHHEWYNGKGYPSGIRDERLDAAARLAAICDVYDALTSHTGYREARSIRESVGLIMARAKTQFSPLLVSRFVREMVPLLLADHLLPVGSMVLLNTGEIARVTELHSDRDLLPVVTIVYDVRKEPVRRPVLIDLTMDGSRSIVTILSDRDIRSSVR